MADKSRGVPPGWIETCSLRGIPVEMMVTLAGGLGFLVGVLFFLVGVLFAIGRVRGRSTSKQDTSDLSVSRSWLVEHQGRDVGE